MKKYICLIIGKIDIQRHTVTKNIRTYIFSTYFRKYLPRFGIGRQLRLELCAVLYTAAKSKGRLFFLCIKSVLSLMEHSFNSQIHKGLFRVCPEYTINQSFIIKKIRI